MFNGLDRRGDSDQALNGLNLISEATLNVLEPGDHREIIPVEEKRSHVSHEHMSFKQGVVRLGQLRGGGCIQRLCDDHTVTFDASEEAAR